MLKPQLQNHLKILILLFVTMSKIFAQQTNRADTSSIEIKDIPKPLLVDKSGIYSALKNNYYGLITKNGRAITLYKYSNIGYFEKGYAVFSIYDKIGYVVKKGYLNLKGKEFSYPYYSRESLNWSIASHPTEIPDSSHLLGFQDRTSMVWTLETLLDNNLKAFVDEPQTYPDLNNLDKVCIGYGLSISGGNYSESYIYKSPEKWNSFKHHTLYPIIQNERWRVLMWNWIKPYYKNAFQKLNPFAKKSYQDCFEYLKNHINSFDEEKYKDFLLKDEKKFAKTDINGKIDSKRKLSSFVDRLILIHKVITPKEAKKWINTLYEEVRTWK
jgi:hypothetical protein